MYQGGDARTAQRLHEAPPGLTPEARARLALERVRRLLSDFTAGTFCDVVWLRDALTLPLADPAAELERQFALGWLAWWRGELVEAEQLLMEAVRQGREAGNLTVAAEAAYWCARARVRLGRKDSISDFEGLLRSLGGSPQATSWFVDLLWRTGHVDRAEQVWRSVRANKRVIACAEGPLLEARALLRKGGQTAAERLLDEPAATAGPVWVERLLLLAWIAVNRKQPERARELLALARQGPYPVSALDAWVQVCEHRASDRSAELSGAERHPLLTDYLRGRQAQRSGDRTAAVAAYREAQGISVLGPFARYALACLGEDDFQALLATQPGLFLAARCRSRIAAERFRRRELGPAELLESVQSAATAGHRNAALEQFAEIARTLEERTTDTAKLRQLASGNEPGSGNRQRAALEQAVRGLPAAELRALLLEWSQPGSLAEQTALRLVLGRQLLRQALLARATGAPVAEEVVAAVERLLPGDDRTTLLHKEGAAVNRWREKVGQVRGQGTLRGVAQALLVQEAAERNDADAVVALLDEAEPWRSFRHRPPVLVLRAVAAITAGQRGSPSWREAIARWLRPWGAEALGEEGAALAAEAGLGPLTTAAVPAGMAPAAWFLHQAARAVARQDFRAALAVTRRAVELDEAILRSENDSPGARAVRDALPQLQRLAQAQSLADAFLPPTAAKRPSEALLVDVVDLLSSLPGGRTLLAAAEADRPQFQAALEALRSETELPPRLAHHLALLERRAAQTWELGGNLAEALQHVRQAWQWWLRLLAVTGPDSLQSDQRTLLLDRLFAEDRQRIIQLLAREEIATAGQHVRSLQELPKQVPANNRTVCEELVERVARFRDDLATEYLLSTREAMQYGDISEGHTSDYNRGLMLLQRLLSIDRDNVRLLTALVEVCIEWFLALYHLGDGQALQQQIGRFTPFALHLVRLIADCPGDLAARAALADYWMFRGLVSGDRAEKIALLREALRFNPANANVHDLLAQLGPAGAVEE
jgi:tetratricopeptide (TPR) repeat protein